MYSTYKNKKNQGFTLVELLISVTLLALVTVISSDTIINLVRITTKTQASNANEMVENFLFLKLQHDIKTSLDAYVPNSCSDLPDVIPSGSGSCNGRVLVLEKADGTEVVYAVGYPTPDNYQLTRYPGGALNDDDQMNKVLVACPSATSPPQAFSQIGCFEVHSTANSPTAVSLNLNLSDPKGSQDETLIESEINDVFTVRGTY